MQAERGELRQQIAAALDSLSFEHRVVIVLFYVNDLSLDEIAFILECPVGTVKSRLFYARGRLRRLLSAETPALGEVPA